MRRFRNNFILTISIFENASKVGNGSQGSDDRQRDGPSEPEDQDARVGPEVVPPAGRLNQIKISIGDIKAESLKQEAEEHQGRLHLKQKEEDQLLEDVVQFDQRWLLDDGLELPEDNAG